MGKHWGFVKLCCKIAKSTDPESTFSTHKSKVQKSYQSIPSTVQPSYRSQLANPKRHSFGGKYLDDDESSAAIVCPFEIDCALVVRYIKALNRCTLLKKCGRHSDS